MNKIWSAYKYIFYRIYSRQEKLFGIHNRPQDAAILGMAISIILILGIIVILLKILFDVNFDYLEKLSIIGRVFIIVLPAILNHFLFIHKKKYLKILEEFANSGENLKNRYLRGWGVSLFSFGPIIVYIGLLFLNIWLSKNEYLPLIS